MAQSALDDGLYATSWETGRLLQTEEALALALAALPQVARGRVDAEVATAITLSPRELEVLRLVASGQTDYEIARALGLRGVTISTHMANIRRKLGAASRAAAVAAAVRHGLA
jgi:DNA-binding CsgD family transcriptional regulator